MQPFPGSWTKRRKARSQSDSYRRMDCFALLTLVACWSSATTTMTSAFASSVGDTQAASCTKCGSEKMHDSFCTGKQSCAISSGSQTEEATRGCHSGAYRTLLQRFSGRHSDSKEERPASDRRTRAAFRSIGKGRFSRLRDGSSQSIHRRGLDGNRVALQIRILIRSR